MSLFSFLESTAVLRIRVENGKLRSVTHKPTAMTHRNSGHFMPDSNHLRRLSAHRLSGSNTKTIPSVQAHLWCDVCIVTSVPKWTDGTHQTRLPTPGLPGLLLPESRTRLLLGVVVVVVVCRKIIRHFEHHSYHRLIQDVSGWQSLSGLSEFAGLIWWPLRKNKTCCIAMIIPLSPICIYLLCVCALKQFVWGGEINDFLHSEDYAALITCLVMVPCRGISILVGGRLMKEIIKSKKTNENWIGALAVLYSSSQAFILKISSHTI